MSSPGIDRIVAGIDTHLEARGALPLDHSNNRAMWRTVILVSGLLLAATFFLPISKSWNSPTWLWRVELEGWPDPGLSISDHFGSFCALIAGYLFGGLMAAGAAARLLGRTILAKTFSFTLALLLTFIAVGVIWAAHSAHSQDSAGHGWFPFVSSLIAAVAILTYVIFATRLHSLAFLCYEFAGSVAVLIWFAFACVHHVNAPVPYLSLLASLGLLVGTTGEAHLILRHSWCDTEWLLFTCLFPERKGSNPKTTPDEMNSSTPV